LRHGSVHSRSYPTRRNPPLAAGGGGRAVGLIFTPPGAISDLYQLIMDMRLIDKGMSVVEAVGLQQSFDHLQTMTVARQVAGHLQHRLGSVISAHQIADGDAREMMRAERRRC
jgi:hypothetical protein